MKNAKLSIDQRLLAAQVAVDNAMKDHKILEALTAYGYDATKITVGKTLYEEVSALVALQKKEYGEQYEATETVNNAWETADKAYKKTLKIARIALRDSVTAQNALALSGFRKKSLSGWLQQAEIFYDNLLGDDALLAPLQAYGYTREKLEAEKALVAVVRDANTIQEKEKGEAQEATEKRDGRSGTASWMRWIAGWVILSKSP